MTFETVYRAGRSQNYKQLLAAIKDSCIDENEIGKPGFSAAAQLASEGDHAAAEFLMTHGAAINSVAFGAALGGDQDYAEDLIRRGATLNYVAEGSGCGGYRDYAENLMVRGAHIDHVAFGAACGGHRDYAEELIRRGANITRVAVGAARGGHQDFAESLILRLHLIPSRAILTVAEAAASQKNRDSVEALMARGISISEIAEAAASQGNLNFAKHLLTAYDADVSFIALGAAEGGYEEQAEALMALRPDIIWRVAIGAASGGHRVYADKLLNRRADIFHMIDYVAHGAAKHGHHGYANELLRRGAKIIYVAQAAKALRPHSGETKENELLRFLSSYDRRFIPKLAEALENGFPSMVINREVKKRAVAISYFRQEQGMSYEEGLIRTTAGFQDAALFLISVALFHAKSNTRYLPSELWLNIMSFLAPAGTTSAQLEEIGFKTGRSLICNGVDASYQSSWFRFFRAKGNSFLEEVRVCQTPEALRSLVITHDSQSRLFRSAHSAVIARWHERCAP